MTSPENPFGPPAAAGDLDVFDEEIEYADNDRFD